MFQVAMVIMAVGLAKQSGQTSDFHVAGLA